MKVPPLLVMLPPATVTTSPLALMEELPEALFNVPVPTVIVGFAPPLTLPQLVELKLRVWPFSTA